MFLDPSCLPLRPFLNAGTGDFRSDAIPGLEVTIQKAEGQKCERCWNYSVRVGENKRYPTICERCSDAIAEIEQDAEKLTAAS